MIKYSSKQTGSAHILIISIMIIVILGFLGFALWNNYFNRKTTSTNVSLQKTVSAPAPPKIQDIYAGWATCTDQADKISFRYPSSWTAYYTTQGPCDLPNPVPGQNELLVEAPRPQNSQYQYRLQFFSNEPNSNNFSAGNGGETILYVMPLNIATSKTPLYLVAYADNTNDKTKVNQLVVTDGLYAVGETVNYVKSVSNVADKIYELSATMEVEPKQQYMGQYSLQDYQSQPDYSNIIKIFQSIKYL